MPNNRIQSLTVDGVTYDIVDNTSGYIKSFTETDPTVPAWAKAANKPTYTAVEVGALPASTTIPTKTSELINDSGFINSDAAYLRYNSFTGGTNSFITQDGLGNQYTVTITPSITETDPVFSASAAAGITSTDISNWNNKMPIVTYGEPVVLVNTTTVEFAKDGDNDWYISAENPISGLTSASFVYDNVYLVEWDGVEYECYYRQALHNSSGVNGYYDWGYIGNPTNLGWAVGGYNDIQAPFCIEYDFKNNANEVQIISYDTTTTHSIKITRIPFIKKIVDKVLYEDVNSGHSLIRKGSGDGAIVIGTAINASGVQSIAIGSASVASGMDAIAIGRRAIASGLSSYAEGLATTASGQGSHAEGQATTASNQGAHAEGTYTIASGNNSHAEGQFTEASGSMSHAEGAYTVANHRAQHVFGEYNVADSSAEAANTYGNYVEIVGNGRKINDVVNRSNARTLDWSGNEWLAGKLTLGANPTAAMDAVTKQYMENQGYLTLATLPIYNGTVE